MCLDFKKTERNDLNNARMKNGLNNGTRRIQAKNK